MHFIAVDPGKTIGLAYWHPLSETWEATQLKDPYRAMAWIETFIDTHGIARLKFTVEKYSGGGYKTAEGTYTTELVGFFSRFLEYTYEVVVRTPISQQRLAGMERVKELIAGTDTPGPHSHDALAHAIVHARLVAGE